MHLAEKLLAGAGILIAIYLILSNPLGDQAATASISGAFNSGVKTLQARA